MRNQREKKQAPKPTVADAIADCERRWNGAWPPNSIGVSNIRIQDDGAPNAAYVADITRNWVRENEAGVAETKVENCKDLIYSKKYIDLLVRVPSYGSFLKQEAA